MRIGFLTPYYPPTTRGGMEISLSHLAVTLARLGHDIRVFTLHYNAPSLKEELDGVHIFRYAWPSDRRMVATRNPIRFRQLARSVRKDATDIELLDAYSLFPPGIEISRALGIPAVLSIRDASAIDRGAVHPTWKPSSRYLLDRLKRSRNHMTEFFYALYGLYLRSRDRRAIEHADLVTFQSNAMCALFSPYAQHSVVIRSIAVMPGENRHSSPHIPGVDFHKDKVVVYAGRLGRGKGVGVLLEAAAQILRTRHNVRFLFIGTGELSPDVAHSPLGKSIIHIAPLPQHDVLSILASAQLTVVPSRIFEGYPRLAIESIAMGTPVVGTSIGGIPEAIGRAGTVVRPDDPRALAQAIDAQLFSESVLRSTRSHLIEQAALHTSDRVAATLLNAYSSLL